MVYKKYKVINGKKYGPYYYETKREGKKVISIYLGTHDPSSVGEKKSSSHKYSFLISFLAILILLGFTAYLFNSLSSSTGNAILNVYTTYNPGENLDGSLRLVLQPGELIPADSAVLLTLGNVSKSYLLSELISSSSTTGSFYASGTSLSGEGVGYGSLGTKLSAPALSFTLRVSGESEEDENANMGEEGENESSSESVKEEQKSEEDKEESKEEGTRKTEEEKSESKETGKEEGKSEEAVKKEEGKGNVSEEKDKEEGKAEKSVTGNAITGERVVSGSVSVGTPFVYTLEEGERVEIVSGSVRKGEERMPDGTVRIEREGNKVSVKTEYSVIEEGYGKEYTEGKERTIEVDLGKLRLMAQAGKLEIRIVSGSEEIVKVEKEISVKELESEENKTLIEEANVTIENESLLNETETNVTLISNETVGNASVVTTRAKIRLGERVKWVKNVSVDEASGNVTIELPAEAENVSVKKRNEGTGKEEEADAVISELTGQVVSGEVTAEIDTERHSALMKFFKSLMGVFTGKVVDEGNLSQEGAADGVVISISENDTATRDSIASSSNDSGSSFNETVTGNSLQANESLSSTEDAVEVLLTDNATDYVIEYFTDAPVATEMNTSNGKQVVISGPDALNYTDVVSYTSIPEQLHVGQENRLRVRWKEGKQDMNFEAFDMDNNTLLDYVEWITPHLSNQTFTIILITKAEHLNEEREYIDDITDAAKTYDNNWTPVISAGHYVRVVFEVNLTNLKDITLFARSSNGGSVQVYQKDSDVLLADFGSFGSERERKQIFLTQLLEGVQQDTFDLKISEGDVEFDQIFDPSVTGCTILSTPESLYSQTASFSGSTSKCIEFTNYSIVFDGQGFLITDSGMDYFFYSNQYNSTIKNARINFTSGGTSWGVEFDTSATNSTVLNVTAFMVAPSNGVRVISSRGPYASIVNNTLISYASTNINTPTSYFFFVNGSSNNITGNTAAFPATGSATKYMMFIGTGALNTLIKSNHFNISQQNGIHIFGGTGHRIVSNFFNSTGGDAISVQSTNVTNLVISDNIFNGWNNPDMISFSSGGDRSNVTNNSFYHQTSGSSTTDLLVAGSSSFLNVSNNFFSGDIASAITVRGDSNNFIANNFNISAYAFKFDSSGSRNNITNNIINTSGDTEHAIFISTIAARNNLFSHNVINASGATTFGFYLNPSANNTFVYNNITVTGLTSDSLQIVGNSHGNVFENNTLLKSNRDGFLFQTSSSITPRVNNLSNNRFFNISRYELNVLYGDNNYTYLINQPIANFSINNSIIYFRESAYGEIIYLEPINGSGTNLSSFLVISNNSIFVNSSLSSGFNKSANVTLYGIGTGYSNPAILRDGALCNVTFGGGCANFTSLNAGTVSFNVTGWSTYSIGERPDSVIPGNITFVTPTYTDGVNFSRTFILVNVTAFDETSISALVIRLYNSTGAMININSTTSSPNYQNYSGLAEGTYYFNATVNDSGNNKNDSATRRVILDTSIPNMVFNLSTEENGSVITRNQIIVNVTANDSGVGVANITITLYNASGVLNVTVFTGNTALFNRSGLADGTYYFNATAIDLLSQRNNTQTRTVTLDTQPIIVTLNSPANRTQNASGLPMVFNLSLNKASGAVVFYTLDSWTNNKSMSAKDLRNYNATNLTILDGVYTARFFANDTAGNINNTVQVTFSVDQTYPAAFYNTSTETNATTIPRGNIAVNVTASDALLQAIVIRLFNASMAQINTSVSSTSPGFVNFTGLSDGTYYFNSTVNDSAGNVNGTELRMVTIDTVVLGVTIVRPTNAGNFTLPMVFNVTLNKAEPSVRYSLDGGVNNVSMSSTAARYNATNLTIVDGTYTLNVYANDTAGNLNTTSSAVFTIDSTVPVPVYASPTPANGSTGRDSLMVNVTVTETRFANITFTLSNTSGLYNQTTFNVTTFALNFTSLADGTYFYNVTVVDGASNRNSTTLRTYLVDTQIPSSIEFTSPTETDLVNLTRSELYVNVTGTDATQLQKIVIRLYNVTGQINSSVTTSSSNFVNFSGLRDGQYWFNATVNDTAGNKNETGTRSVRLDTTKPTPYYGNTTEADASVIGRTNIQINVTVTDNTEYRNMTIRFFNASGILNTTFTNLSSYQINYTGLLNGTYTFNATAVDFVGLENSTVTRTVEIQTSALVLEFIGQTEGDGTNLSKSELIVNVTVTNRTAVETLVVRLHSSAGQVNYSATTGTKVFVNWTGLANGRYWFNATANDTSGNAIAAGTRTVLLDTVNPLMTYGVGMEVTGENKSRNWVYVNVSVTDLNEGNITFYLSNATGLVNATVYLGGNRSINFTGLADGVYTYNATIVDQAGNRNHTASRTITLDTITPLISFGVGTVTNGSARSQNWTYMNLSVTETNEFNVTFSLFNRSTMLNYTTGVAGNRSLNFTGLADGTYFYNVTVRDYAGNTNVTELRTIVLDTAKPTSIAFAAPTETDLVNLTRSNLMVNVSATDSANVAYILIRLYNGSRALIESSTSTSGAVSWFVNFSLGDNLYYFNATVNDTAGNTNDSATRQVIVDTASPTLLGSSAPDVVRYGNASIEVNASDLGTGLAYGNANVTYPNGTVTSYVMSLTSSTFRLVIANMTLVGDYDVNVTFNDTLGHLNTTLLKFEVYNVAANISGGGTDALGNLRNYSYTFLRPGSDVVLFNLTNSSYNLTNREVKQRNYDLAVTLASQTVLLRNLTFNTSFIPVNLDNLTGIDTNITNYKVLAGLAVNSTYTGTATVNLSYSGLYDSSSAAVAESGLTVHKCSTWNFTGRSCVGGSFALQSEKWTAAGADQALVNTTSFSAFIVTEYTCGNSICQAAYGEDTSTCSADCSSGSSGGSSGGGGGGAATATQAEKEKEKEKQIENAGTGALQVNVPRIERELTVGEQLPEQLTFTNTLTTDQEITFTMDARLRSVLFAPEKVTVKAGESLNVPLLINGTKEGVYIGKLQITSTAGVQTIPVKIVILSKESKLLDLSVTLPVDRVAPNQDLVFKVEAYNLGQLRQYEVLLQYDIVNKNTNQSVLHQEETTSVGAVLSLLKTIHIPEAVPEGNYRLVVTAVYDESQASAFASFAVEKSLFSTFFKDYAALGLMILVVGFMLFAGFYYLFALRKKIFEQKMQEKKKNSIYPFPDFNLLPKSGYAYVGHVADADEKTYLDYTQLNRHTLIAGGTGSGKTVAGMVAVEELLKKGGSAVVFDPVGQWTGFAKRNEDAGMLKLYKKFGLHIGVAFRPTVFTIDDATLNIDVVHYLKRKGLTVFRMDKLTPKKADVFIENCLAKIYRADLNETSSLRSLVVLDEVHRLLPKYGGHRAYTKLEQAVREFRKWGIGLLMISQVLTDFKGAIRGNIGTEIQMHTRYEGDIKRVRERHGADVSKLIARMPVGIGMVESTGYNKGQPYFIEFRPLLHSPFKLSESEMKSLVRHEEPVLSEGVLAGVVEKKESTGKKAGHQQKHEKQGKN